MVCLNFKGEMTFFLLLIKDLTVRSERERERRKKRTFEKLFLDINQIYREIQSPLFVLFETTLEHNYYHQQYFVIILDKNEGIDEKKNYKESATKKLIN